MTPETDMRDLFATAVTDEPSYADPAGRAQGMGRTLRRRRRIAGGVGALAVVSTVAALFTFVPLPSFGQVETQPAIQPTESAGQLPDGEPAPSQLPITEEGLIERCRKGTSSPAPVPLDRLSVFTLDEPRAAGLFRSGEKALAMCTATATGIQVMSTTEEDASQHKPGHANLQFNSERGVAWGLVPDGVARITFTGPDGVEREAQMNDGAWFYQSDGPWFAATKPRTDAKELYTRKMYGADGDLEYEGGTEPGQGFWTQASGSAATNLPDSEEALRERCRAAAPKNADLSAFGSLAVSSSGESNIRGVFRSDKSPGVLAYCHATPEGVDDVSVAVATDRRTLTVGGYISGSVGRQGLIVWGLASPEVARVTVSRPNGIDTEAVLGDGAWIHHDPTATLPSKGDFIVRLFAADGSLLAERR